MSADLDRIVRDAVAQAMASHGWNGAESPGAGRASALVGDVGAGVATATLDRPTSSPLRLAPEALHGRQSGSDFCTHCGGCMEPAVYERHDREPPGSVAAMLDRLDRFTELTWKSEPQDVRRLRQLSRPPMGRLPGIMYANFNLFWLGENLQTIRDKSRTGSIPIEHLNQMLASACLRSAIRLSKWHLLDVIALLSDVVGFTERAGCRNHSEMKTLVEHLLIAVDRVQGWVDRMIPWHRMDACLEPVP